MKKERLSALVDGELDENDVHAAARQLEQADALARMELYYRIGEELRADSAKAALSPEFASRMAAALAAEPPLEWQGSTTTEMKQESETVFAHPELSRKPAEIPEEAAHTLRQLTISSFAVVVVMAIIMSPQLMGPQLVSI